jgi:hypothetical protein
MSRTTRRILVCAALITVLHAQQALGADRPVAEVGQLRLYSSFWENLHHFLYASAWATRPVVPGARRLAMPLPAGPDPLMTPDEKATWDRAVAAYDREFASKDLLFDRGMTAIKRALIDRDDALTGAPVDDQLRTLLLSAAPVYRKYWWPAHDAANRAWIDDAVRRAVTYSPAIIARLTTLYGVPWFAGRVRVDVVRVGKSQGAYTSLDPTHIVVASADASYGEWSSVEMLFHESSHGLIQKVRERVDAALVAADKPRSDLWHVVLFYIAGEVTRQELAKHGIDYTPYLYATGLFDRAWPQFRRPVEQTVRPFVDGRITVAQMAVSLAAAIP